MHISFWLDQIFAILNHKLTWILWSRADFLNETNSSDDSEEDKKEESSEDEQMLIPASKS